jgi:hypothetical protein
MLKTRHASALALVVWYLMYPPWNTAKQAIDATLPLRNWYQVSNFDSSGDCRTHRIATLTAMDEQIAGYDAEKRAEAQKLWYEARCMSADDPRLRPK